MGNGMTLWIVLGVLVAAVVIFLIVASVIDRKKSKKLKFKKLEEDKLKGESKGRIAIAINIINAKNKELLKNFRPSVGKYKMSDIKNKAKKSMQTIEKTKEFKLLKLSEDDAFVLERFMALKSINSNLWNTKFKDIIDFFENIEKELDKEVYKVYKEETVKKIKGVYK